MAGSEQGTTGSPYWLSVMGPNRVGPPVHQRGRPLSTTLTPSDAPQLTAADRCDRCSAQAYVRAIMPGGGDLIFCNHHAKQYEEHLRKVAVRIIDSEATLT